MSRSGLPKGQMALGQGFYASCSVSSRLSMGCPNRKRIDKEENFPFWAALDKHTPQGKIGLREVANKTRIPWRQLNWASFYFASANVNELAPSRRWKNEVELRLGKVGLSVHEAESIWAKA